MFPFLRRITPMQWVRAIQAYLVIGALGAIGLSMWILQPAGPESRQSSKTLGTSSGPNTEGPIRFPPVPPPEMAKYLQKRLRSVEISSEIVPPATSSPADPPISQPLPEFTGDLIATFIEQDDDSRAVFRIGGLPTMIAIGESITQAGIEFRLTSVERHEVELAAAGQLIKVRMRD